MTTAPGRSIHVDFETSELKSTSRQFHTPDPLSPTYELTPTYKVIQQQKCWVGGYITSQGRQWHKHEAFMEWWLSGDKK